MVSFSNLWWLKHYFPILTILWFHAVATCHQSILSMGNTRWNLMSSVLLFSCKSLCVAERTGYLIVQISIRVFWDTYEKQCSSWLFFLFSNVFISMAWQNVSWNFQAWLLWDEEKPLQLIDECLKESYDESQMLRCIQVGLANDGNSSIHVKQRGCSITSTKASWFLYGIQFTGTRYIKWGGIHPAKCCDNNNARNKIGERQGHPKGWNLLSEKLKVMLRTRR